MPNLRVLISGAGIAGPALAFWLTRLGHQCTVLERFPEIRKNGQQVDIKEQGVDVVEKMGLLDEIRKYTVKEAGVRFINKKERQRAMFPMVAANKGGGLSSEFEIMRGDLSKILYDATADRTEYRFNVSVQDFKDLGDKVEVTLSDGRVEEYDILVAADGLRSRIRKKLLGEEVNKQAQHDLGSGLYVGYFSTDRVKEDQDIATVCHTTKGRVLLTRYHSKTRGQGYLCAMSRRQELEESMKGSVTDQKKAFDKFFHDAGWQSQRLIEAMHKADDFYAERCMQIRSPIWSKGRVTLLGDAGYAPSAVTGMGTSLAIIGAYVLAGEIARHDSGDVVKALEEYERALRPFVEDIQSLPLGMLNLMYPSSQLGVSVLHGVLGFVSGTKLYRAVEYVGRKIGNKSWEIPEPPVVLQMQA